MSNNSLPDKSLIGAMRSVAMRSRSRWERDFALSIYRQSTGRAGRCWSPSEKQRVVMRRLVDQLDAIDDDPGDLVERKVGRYE